MEIEFVDVLPGKKESAYGRMIYDDLKSGDMLTFSNPISSLCIRTAKGYFNIFLCEYSIGEIHASEAATVTLYDVKIYAAVKK